MNAPSYSGYRFPPDVIQRAVWMYLRGFGARGGWPEFPVRRMMVAMISGRGGDGEQASERDEAGSICGPELAGL